MSALQADTVVSLSSSQPMSSRSPRIPDFGESCAGAGMPGAPQLSDQELLEQTIQSAGSSVSRGKVRRKKDPALRRSGRGGLAELTRMR